VGDYDLVAGFNDVGNVPAGVRGRRKLVGKGTLVL
jgi:hypothetical protein